jgi:hypothetical protein
MKKILGLCLAALLCTTMSCMFTEPGELVAREGPIPGITPNVDGPDEHQFDMEFKVWYYKGVGRVIFRPDGRTVYATEADKHQGGLPN